MNRKGNIPITLLVIGIFVVCSLAIVTFFISSSKVNSSFTGVSIMRELDSQINQYKFLINEGISKDKAKSFFPVRQNSFGEDVLFFEIKDTRWSWDVANGFRTEYVAFSVEYVLP